jgi:hypothetical protein
LRHVHLLRAGAGGRRDEREDQRQNENDAIHNVLPPLHGEFVSVGASHEATKTRRVE